MEAKKDKKQINYWIEKSKQPLESLSYKEYLVFKFLQISMEGAIEEWAKENGLNFQTILNLLKEKTEKLVHFSPKIYRLNNSISGQVKKFLSEGRLNSWFREDYKNVEDSRSQPIGWIKEKDGNGVTKDISIDTSRVRPPNLYSSVKSNPEELFLDNEFHLKIMNLLNDVKSSRKKHAPTFFKILEMILLEGIIVKPVHGHILGVPGKKVPFLKFQTLQLAKKLVLQKYPELIEVINTLRRGTNHQIEKSTRKDRERQRRSDNDDEMKKHGPILIWTRDEGYKTLSYEEAVRLQKLMLRPKKKRQTRRPWEKPSVPHFLL